MYRVQKWILCLLRHSHRWERVACTLIGAGRYQRLKNWMWQRYVNESLKRTRMEKARRTGPVR